METTKTIKELLELLYNDVYNDMNSDKTYVGLCARCMFLHINCQINIKEYEKLQSYIEEHKPFIARFRYDNYYWNLKKTKPRLKWLKKHIKKQSK